MKHNTCSFCKTLGHYSERFDAHYCPKCNTWLEVSCGSDLCIYCSGRPLTPKEFYMRKPETYSTVKYPVHSLEHFKILVVSGSVLAEDGAIGSIFVDGVDQVGLYLPEWSSNIPVTDKQHDFSTKTTLEDLDKLFPGKTIQIEWYEIENDSKPAVIT